LNYLFEGESNRTVSSHQLNKESSRSHCIYTIHLESKSRVESSEKVVFSKLHLVDLAGSERTKKSGAQGVNLKEATFINKSLTFLEQVVVSVCDNKRDHIPYRQSKLTNLLKNSIGGNCQTLMIANVYPEPDHLEETISTLKFATRMMKVNNEPFINI
jgi:kinesin family protein 6/9